MNDPARNHFSIHPPAILTGIIVAMIGWIWIQGQILVREDARVMRHPHYVPGAEPDTRSQIDHVRAGLSRTDSVAAMSLISAHTQSLSAAGAEAAPVDPDLTLGSETCVKCHAGEVTVWRSTPHNRTFDELHRRPEAKAIAAKLGITSIKHDGRCATCHYTQKTDVATGNVHAIEGIACESCHGSAKHYLDVHHDYGGEWVTRELESPEHRATRLSRSIELGMRNPVNVYLVAQSCLRCHTTADEELVNVGGHPTGSLDFEFVSWSQGSIRHNFVRSNGQTNAPSSLDRLRLMFVSGMIAELEASLRATGVATQKATYGITSAQRTDRAAKRLRSVAEKVSSRLIDNILLVYDQVELKLNNEPEMFAAAEVIAKLGYRFAAETDSVSLAGIDAFIPPADRWK